MQIRNCTPGDFDEIAALLLQLWPGKPQNREKLRRVYFGALSRPGVHYFCADRDGKIAGFGGLTIKENLWQEANLAVLDYLVVDDALRGEGLGGALLDHAIGIAHDNTCACLELDSAFHRREAHAFYEHRGFEKRAYYFSLGLTETPAR
jgi:GNAT superfamily N-acetyltransferase